MIDPLNPALKTDTFFLSSVDVIGWRIVVIVSDFRRRGKRVLPTKSTFPAPEYHFIACNTLGGPSFSDVCATAART
jgi:hypothetical protein